MAEPLRPTATKAFARQNWVIVLTIASPAAPTVAEVTAVSTLDITNIAFREGAPKPTQNTNVVEQEKRFGDTRVGKFIGTTTYDGGELIYQFAPQAAALSDGKKAWEKIPEGTTGYLVERIGVAKATSFAAGQFVNVWPVEFGPSISTVVGDEESAESAAMCTFAITDPSSVKQNVAIAA